MHVILIFWGRKCWEQKHPIRQWSRTTRASCVVAFQIDVCWSSLWSQVAVAAAVTVCATTTATTTFMDRFNHTKVGRFDFCYMQLQVRFNKNELGGGQSRRWRPKRFEPTSSIRPSPQPHELPTKLEWLLSSPGRRGVCERKSMYICTRA